MSTRQHFMDSVNTLNQQILKLGSMVEEALRKSLAAAYEHDTALAEEVITYDKQIDNMQLYIEDQCVQIIAMEQPVAHDLRELVTSLKVVTSLERIGDHAAHLAKVVKEINDTEMLNTLPNISKMTEIGISMVHDVVTAFIEQDAEKAKEIAKRDNEIDKLHKEMIKILANEIVKHPEKAEEAFSLLSLNRFLERMGDHVTNICEFIVFGKEAKHIELNY